MVCPCTAMRSKIALSCRGGRTGVVVLLAHAPTGGDDLGHVVGGDAVVEIERGGVAGLVGRLVDDDGGGRGVDGGQLDVERRLTRSRRPSRRASRPP